MSMKRRQFVQSAALLPLVAAIPGHVRAQALTTIPGISGFPTNLSSYSPPYTFQQVGARFFAKAFNLPTRPYGSTGLYVEFDIDNFANYITTNAVAGKHFAINLYDNKTAAPFTGRAGSEFGWDAISTGVGSAIGNLSYNGTTYQCVWLEAFRKGNVLNCQKETLDPNRDKILLDYGLGLLSNLVNPVTVKVWSSQTASGRYDIGIQVVDRMTGATLLYGSNPATPALAVMDPTGYRITGPLAGTTNTLATAEYTFDHPTVSVISVTAGDVGTQVNDTPLISAGRYLFY